MFIYINIDKFIFSKTVTNNFSLLLTSHFSAFFFPISLSQVCQIFHTMNITSSFGDNMAITQLIHTIMRTIFNHLKTLFSHP